MNTLFKKAVGIVFWCMFFSVTMSAQTIISGGIYSDTTWEKANSPYIVTGNVVVFEGVKLTIEPGVIVKFNFGIGLEVRGKLEAIGNALDSITFTSNISLPFPSSWSGVTVIGNAYPLGVGNQVTMEYCIGEYANYFINLDLAYHGPYVFRNCYFKKNHQVNYDGGMPATIFEHCLFESNNTALGGCQFDSRVSHSSFINNLNGVNGFRHIDSCYFSGNTGVALSPNGSTVGCFIENNNTAVSCFFNSGNNRFENNIVTNNVIGVEMLSYFDGSILFKGNTICKNSDYNIKLIHSNNADLHLNCWCSSDADSIRSTMYDGYVDISLGLINFLPITTVCPLEESVGVQSISKEASFVTSVFPNPFSCVLTFDLASNELSHVSLYDFLGQLISQQTFTKSTTVNTAQLANGIYFYELRNSKGQLSNGKLVKQ